MKFTHFSLFAGFGGFAEGSVFVLLSKLQTHGQTSSASVLLSMDRHR